VSAVSVDRSSEQASDPLSGKNPTLPPTPNLSPDEFEDFTERLLSAHRFSPDPVRRVTRVERWGRRGDAQDGIDFEGEFSDGATAAWQCKRYDKLPPADIRAAVSACTFEADEYYLVFSGEASRNAQNEIKKHPRWQLLDRRGLGRLLDDLPLHKRRDVLDATWGKQTRQFLLETPGSDAFLSIETFAADRVDPDTLLNDRGPRVGREAELVALRNALDRASDWPQVVVVTGPGGRGKTRLLTEALGAFQDANPGIPVICLSPGRVLDQAAMDELPSTPAIVMIDDAHKDPVALSPLLAYARLNDGIQLVLGSRGSGVNSLQSEIALSRYAPAQVETISVDQLSRQEARALVNGLAEGLDLTFAAREYFIGQATDSPHVAVIAINLIRRGELTAPPVVDTALRQQVLARYQEVATGPVDGVAATTVRRVFAVYAALSPVDDSDTALRSRIATFCGLGVIDLLRLCQGLQDRGVLVTRDGLIRVVPDVLADELLETEAAVGAHATGFAEQLWGTFGSPEDDRLIVTLAELDWRLARRGGPSIIGPIWAAVRHRVGSADTEGLRRALRGLGNLASTLPASFVEVLEEVRRRLQGNNAEDHHAVLALLPEMYGQCAAGAPELLEVVLDALWALCRDDSRPPNQFPGHPERVIEDRLANVGQLIDPTFPLRIAGWVDNRLSEPGPATPMFALRPLLAKEGTHTVTETRRRISFRPYAISAAWARPVRDAIRSVLRRQASGTDVRRAGEAVELLGTALRQPAGLVGRTVTIEEILGWEDDDLATLATLRSAAAETTSPVIRRLIRMEVAWTSEHARSIRSRHAALTLVTELDERDDDLAEALLSVYGRGKPTRRGLALPTLAELQAAAMARAAGEAGATQEQLEAARNERVRETVDNRRMLQEQHIAEVVEQLASGTVTELVEAVRQCAAEVEAAAPRKTPALWGLWRGLALARPDLLPKVVQEIAKGPAGAIDKNLDQLLDSWAAHDEAGLLVWLTLESELRIGVRLAIANAFANYSWTDHGTPFVELHRRGTADSDPELRDRFMIGTHKLLALEPASTAQLLVREGASPFAAIRALEGACAYDGLPWGRSLSREDAIAVLDLIDHAGWEDHTAQQIAAGIARAHPDMVLDHLETLCREGGRLPLDVEGFAETFDENAEALANWVVARARRGEGEEASRVVSIAMHSRMTPAQAQSLTGAVDDLDSSSFPGLVAALQDAGTWPLHHPGLASRLLARARTLSDDNAIEALAAISRAMFPGHWGFMGGVSTELNQARAAAAEAAETERDPELKAAFRQAEKWATAQAALLLAEDDDDEE
jgi:hypothetical protein